MVLPTENALHVSQVLAGIGMCQACSGVVLCTLEHALRGSHSEALAMKQAVADGHLDAEVGRLAQLVHIAGQQRRNQQPESRNRDRKRVQVHSRHGIQRLLGDVAPVARGLGTLPFIHEAVERTQQKVA